MIVALAFVVIATLVAVDKYLGSRGEPPNLDLAKKRIDQPADGAALAAVSRAQPEADANTPTKDSAGQSRQMLAAPKNRIDKAPTGSALAARQKGWVYLGLCADGDRWLQSFFDDVPACVDGPVEPPVIITSMRGVKVRARPSTAGSEVNRLREHGRVHLLRMLSFRQETANDPGIFWGEIELSPRSESPSDGD